MEITQNNSNASKSELDLIKAIAQEAGAGEHIKAVCRMAMNTMNSADAKLDQQTLYSAFALIEILAGGKEDDLFTMDEVYSNINAEDFE